MAVGNVQRTVPAFQLTLFSSALFRLELLLSRVEGAEGHADHVDEGAGSILAPDETPDGIAVLFRMYDGPGDVAEHRGLSDPVSTDQNVNVSGGLCMRLD
ncbi:hypothetical protein WKI68_06435 [Streptomyces sp. MS1.HAVA.3]|uniref:Uncharacterized protein n=1 Tax=Streptomyces caledonius TaxID=3134107 RepID=A0ABU8U006_9ACTN